MRLAGTMGFARALWRAYGVRGSVYRAWFELRKKLGRYRTDPAPVPASAERSPLPAGWSFIVDSARVREATDRTEALARANRVLHGEHQAYRWTWVSLPRSEADWLTNPSTGFRYDPKVPWFRIPHYERDAGDIKDVWEPARFGWSYDLMRGFMLTGDDRYAAAFWRLLETFLDANLPFRSVHWSCGQETTIRAVAWLWAEAVFQGASSTTPERLARLRRALVWSAERIEDGLGYAIIQRNNHGISEASGLAVLGARFVDDEPRARDWLETAHRLLESQILDQFLADGWYIQHSFNYARLALEQVVVAQGALRARGRSLSSAACGRISAAVRMLADVMDPASGRVPNHGPNDGAYVLPLSTATYVDYRPALTAAAAVCGGSLPPKVEPNAEVLAWLGAPPPAVAPAARLPLVRTGSSGWVIARTGSVLLFARAGRYRSRPSHMDPLHVDLWVDGRPVAIDAGTYRYWASPPWTNGLAVPEVHNTITIDGLPVATRGPRYLWVRWPAARIVSAGATAADSVRIELANDSWREHGIKHRRICEIGPTTVTVTDELRAPRSLRTRVTAHWLLDVDPGQLSISGSRDIELDVVSGQSDSIFGWSAEGYGEKRAVKSVRARALLADGQLRIVSEFDVRTAATAIGNRIAGALAGSAD